MAEVNCPLISILLVNAASYKEIKNRKDLMAKCNLSWL